MVFPKNFGLAPKNSSFLKLSNHVWCYGSKTEQSYLKNHVLPKITLKMWFLCDTLSPYLTLSKYCRHLAFDNITFGTFYYFPMLPIFKMSHREACCGWKCRNYEHICKKNSLDKKKLVKLLSELYMQFSHTLSFRNDLILLLYILYSTFDVSPISRQ